MKYTWQSKLQNVWAEISYILFQLEARNIQAKLLESRKFLLRKFLSYCPQSLWNNCYTKPQIATLLHFLTSTTLFFFSYGSYMLIPLLLHWQGSYRSGKTGKNLGICVVRENDLGSCKLQIYVIFLSPSIKKQAVRLSWWVWS